VPIRSSILRSPRAGAASLAPEVWRVSRTVGVLLGMTAALLLTAVYNGDPFFFGDSGEYIRRAFSLRVPMYRSIGYSIWIAFTGGRASLWAPIIAQALLLAALLRILARVLVPGVRAPALLLGAVALSLLTAVSARVGQLMPDIFGATLVVSLYLAVAHWERLGRAARAVVLVGVVAGVVVHATHPMIAACLLLAWALGAARAGRAAAAAWRGVLRGALIVATALAGLVGINYAQTGRVYVSAYGHVFLLAHLVDAGLVTRLLVDECPRVHYDLCPYLGAFLEKPDGVTAEEFLWNPRSPLYYIGGFEGSGAETARILRATLRRYPGQHLELAVAYTADQFGAIRTFDGFESLAKTPWVAGILRQELPWEYQRFRAARQQRDAIGLRWLEPVHALVALIAALASLWLLWRSRRERSAATLASPEGFHRTVWLALIANAVVCANLSAVADRYQTRLVWLLPAAVLISIAAWCGRRQEGTRWLDRGVT
jgi:hypothetical protein